MTEKVELTIVFDGLIEGKLPEIDGIEEKFRQWIGFAADLGIRFNLEISGSSFSILPETKPVSCNKLGEQPEEAVKQLLEQLLELLPEEGRSNVFSTLRSSEYKPGCEVQSLYAIGTQGGIRCETRTVDAKTTPPPTPISTRERIWMVVYGLVIVLAVLGVTSIFVDLRGIFDQFAGAVKPVEADEIEIDLGSFGEFITLEEKKVDSATGTLVLSLKRTKKFPTSEEELQKAFEKSGNSLPRRLAVESIARGYVRCELFDKDKKFYGSFELRIHKMRTEETIQIGIKLHSGENLMTVPPQTGKKKHFLHSVKFTF